MRLFNPRFINIEGRRFRVRDIVCYVQEAFLYDDEKRVLHIFLRHGGTPWQTVFQGKDAALRADAVIHRLDALFGVKK